MAGKAEAMTKPITTLKHRGPEQIGVGQHQGERQRPQDGNPDHIFAPEMVAHRAARQGAHRHRRQEHEQMHLRRLHRNAEGVDQVEGVIAADAG